MITLSYLQFALIATPSAVVMLSVVWFAYKLWRSGMSLDTIRRCMSAGYDAGAAVEIAAATEQSCRAPAYCMCQNCAGSE